jgi:hypothetical protein
MTTMRDLTAGELNQVSGGTTPDQAPSRKIVVGDLVMLELCPGRLRS